ncbi:Cytochrome monooxygenase lcsI [Penicillium oxalicum]|uniref:Cytochrome monooxygenase lcsI n=1 Tax=Penicillium oxalicum TaxID=69781 RepID=UPI0020B69F89|nr:Cytochrome monooxygenase lcsI [Penicillium oxalicum]KAI2794707.1 Cytochrome monooxygenase lcsI [Penicillium oxalicum]
MAVKEILQEVLPLNFATNVRVVLGAAISTVLIYGVVNVVYNLFFSPLAKFPGPKLAACSHVPNFYWLMTGQHHYKMKELHDEYGDVVRVSPTTLVYRSPQAWKDIYGHRKAGQGSFLKDPGTYISGPSGPSIINSNEADHSRERRLLSHAFSEKALRDQEGLVQSYVNLLVERLKEQIDSAPQSTVDLVSWYNFTTFDIIGDLAFGEPFWCLRDSQYHPWVQMVFISTKTSVFLRPGKIYPVLAPFLKKLVPGKLAEMRASHFSLSTEKVRRRLQTKTDRPDFMTYVLRATDERAMTIREMESNAALLILAGSETTATLLSGFTYYMLVHPEVQRKLLEEVRGSFKSFDAITFQAVAQLPYLNAALEETLRMYPPVADIIPRVVPKGGAMVDGQFIPEDTVVTGQFYSSFHAESHFTEPDSFIPERWLEPRDPRFENDTRAVFHPFSLGPRNCLGKNLAYAEMRLITAKMLWSFDMTLQEGAGSWPVQETYNLWEKKPLMVKLARAQKST